MLLLLTIVRRGPFGCHGRRKGCEQFDLSQPFGIFLLYPSHPKFSFSLSQPSRLLAFLLTAVDLRESIPECSSHSSLCSPVTPLVLTALLGPPCAGVCLTARGGGGRSERDLTGAVPTASRLARRQPGEGLKHRPATKAMRTFWLSAIVCLLATIVSAFITPETVTQTTVKTDIETPLLRTRIDVEEFFHDQEQEFKKETNEALMENFVRRQEDAGIPMPRVSGLGKPVVFNGEELSTADFFTWNEASYAVIALKTLNGSYIGRVSVGSSGELHIKREGFFSAHTFVDSQYRASFLSSLWSRPLLVKAAVAASGQPVVLVQLDDGQTLTFLVTASLTPRYQDCLLTSEEMAADAAFFTESGQLYVTVAVGQRRQNGTILPATRSYVYRLSGGVKWLHFKSLETPNSATAVTTFSYLSFTYIIIGQSQGRSLVFRHEIGSSEMKLFQYLPFKYTVSVQAFSHNTNIFLLLASSHGTITLYWWTAEQLVIWQTIQVGSSLGALSLAAAATLPHGLGFIYALRAGTLYLYSERPGGHFVESASHSVEGASPDYLGCVGLLAAGHHFLMADGGSWTTLPIIVSHTHKVSGRDGQDPLLACLDELQDVLDDLDGRLDRLLQLATGVFRQGQTARVTAPVTVTNMLLVNGATDVHQLSISSNMSVGFESVSLTEIQDDAKNCSKSVSDLNGGLRTALTFSTPQTITGSQTFTSLGVTSSMYISRVTSLTSLNSQPFQRLVSSTLKYNAAQTVRQPLTLGSAYVTNLHLQPHAALNHLPNTDDLMYVSGEQVVTGQHRYRQLGVTGDLWLDGPLNGVFIATLLERGQTLTVARAELASATASKLLVSHVNERELAAWQRDSILLSRPQTFYGDVTAGSAVFSDLSVLRLNGRLLSSLLTDLVRQERTVHGRTVLSGTVSVRQLTVGRLGGLRLPEDVLTTDSDQSVMSQLRVRTLEVTRDIIADSVNGLNLTTDVLLTSGGAISGSVLFPDDLVVSGSVLVPDGVTVSGVDLSEAALSGPAELRLAAGLVTEADWTVQGSLRLVSIGSDRLDDFAEIFWTADGDQVVSTAVSLPDGLSVDGNLTVGTINGVSTDSFVSTEKGGTIHTDIVFLGGVTADHVTLPEGGRLGSRDLSEFARTVVTRSGDQTIAGVKTFSGGVEITSLLAGKINGLKVPEDLILINADRIQTGSLTYLRDPEVLDDVVSAGDVNVTGTINGHRVRDIVGRVSSRDAGSDTSQTLIVHGRVHFLDVTVLERVNSAVPADLLDSLLYTNREELVTDELTVTGHVTVTDHLQLGSVNGLDWTRYLKSLILSDVGGSVSDTTALSSSMIVSEPASLSVTSLNSLTQHQLTSQFLSLNTEQAIPQRISVFGSVRADKVETGSVSGVPVDQLMFTDRELHFHRPLHLFSNVSASQLTVSGSRLGDCHLAAVWRDGLRRAGPPQALRPPVALGALSVTGDVHLADVTSQRLLQQLTDRIVTKDGDHVVTGPVTFAGGLSASSANIAVYGDERVDALAEDALMKDSAEPVTLAGPLTVQGAVTFSDVTVTSDVLAGRVNGAKVWQWAADLVTSHSSTVQLAGVLKMENGAAEHILTSGDINGAAQSAWVERNASLSAAVFFDDGVTVKEGVTVSGTTAGVDVTSVLQSSVSRMSDVTVHSDVTFERSVAVWLNMSVPAVNGVLLSDLALSHRPDLAQTFTGEKRFDLLHVSGGVCGRVGGLNLTALCGALLSSEADTVQVIHGKLNFMSDAGAMGTSAVADLSKNVTASTALLLKEKTQLANWTADVTADIVTLWKNASALLQDTDYSVDLAYLLLTGRVFLPEAAALVPAADRPAAALTVLLRRPAHNCSLPADCSCVSTVPLQVQDGGRLDPSGPDSPGLTWSFYIPHTRHVFTAAAPGYSAGCEGGRLTVSSRPAGAGVDSSSERPLETSAVRAGVVSDVRMYGDDDRVYMVVSYGAAGDGDQPATEVYVLKRDVWRPVQTLSSPGAAALEVTLTSDGPHLLSVTSASAGRLSVEGKVQLWVWSRETRQFTELSAPHPAEVTSAMFLHAHDKILVAIADTDGLTVLEYLPDRRLYAVCQYLPVQGVAAMTSFTIGAETYHAVYSAKHNQIIVYLVTHLEGLQRHCWYPATGVRALATYQYGGRLYLAAVHSHGLAVYSVVVRGRQQLSTPAAQTAVQTAAQTAVQTAAQGAVQTAAQTAVQTAAQGA